MNLVKTKSGVFIPAYPSDHEAAAKVPIGAEVYATQQRNPLFHRKGFALLKLGFDSQDKFDNFEIYRQIVTMKAGFVHFVKGTDGAEHPLPHSLAFDKMSAESFEKWYVAIREVISREAKIDGADIDNNLESFY